MNKNKKRILSGLLALWLISNISYDHKTKPSYEIIRQEEYFARYSKGNVYIGSIDVINALDNVSSDDVLIIDNRNNDKDPCIKILSSYKLVDPSIRNEILEIISIYEKENPSSWKRTISSMKIEWFVHNILYYLNYKINRTKDVDLNNQDEDMLKKRLIKRIMGN